MAVTDQTPRRRSTSTNPAAAGRARPQDTNTPPPEPDPDPDNTNTGRTPPTDPAAEQAVLGTCLLGRQELVTQARTLLPDGRDWFYDPRNAKIWRLITTLADRDQPCDPITIADHARTSGEVWREPADTQYLHHLYNQAPLVGQLDHHAAILTRYEGIRRLDLLAVRMRQAVTSGDHDTLLRHAQNLRDDIDQALAHQNTGLTVDTWTPLDLEPALSGGIITPPPTVLARLDGAFLLYIGRLHSLAGEPESGKSFIALLACCQALEDNQHVIYIDFEDTPEGIVGRLLAMGARPDWIRDRFHYIRPDRPIDDQARNHLRHLVENNFCTLAVIDGVTEAMTMHGLATDKDNTDAAHFYELLPRFITHLPAPPAVLMIDHVIKDEDRTKKRYALGAQHKLAGLDGAAFMVDIVTPFAPGQPGMSRIRVSKDRPGQVRKNSVKQVIAELHINGDDTVVKAELRLPPQENTSGGDGHWRPTILMERVSRYLETHPGATGTDVESAVRGKATHKRAAIDALIAEGYVSRDKGERRGYSLRVLYTFRNSSEEPGGSDE